MIYTEMTKKAILLAYKAHMGQVDRCGLPYIFHPYHLAEQMDSEETVTAALLHDVVEDTAYTMADLAAEGFPESVMEAVELLTHDESVSYMDYVRKIKDNPITRAVKLADLAHNSDLSRLDQVREKDLARMEKYRQAMALLQEE